VLLPAGKTSTGRSSISSETVRTPTCEAGEAGLLLAVRASTCETVEAGLLLVVRTPTCEAGEAGLLLAVGTPTCEAGEAGLLLAVGSLGPAEWCAGRALLAVLGPRVPPEDNVRFTLHNNGGGDKKFSVSFYTKKTSCSTPSVKYFKKTLTMQ
jgi:hypothetical protein